MESTDLPAELRKPVSRIFRVLAGIIAIVGLLSLALSGVLYYICCLAGGLEQAERILQLPQRSGKAVLAIALTRLARHYRLLKTPVKSEHSKDFGHWAMADYRPQIMPAAPDAHQT